MIIKLVHVKDFRKTKSKFKTNSTFFKMIKQFSSKNHKQYKIKSQEEREIYCKIHSLQSIKRKN